MPNRLQVCLSEHSIGCKSAQRVLLLGIKTQPPHALTAISSIAYT